MKLKQSYKPLIKYPGGKEKELPVIFRNMPENIENYYEPFVGGGAVYFGANVGKRRYINDKSRDLISFYICVKNKDDLFYAELKKWNDIMHSATETARSDMQKRVYEFHENLEPCTGDEKLNDLLKDKYQRTRSKAEKEGELKDLEAQIEACYKQQVYLAARDVYNTHKKFDGERAAAFVMMRQYGFSGMFRFNSNNEFNIPYGGIAYNQKYLDQRIEFMESQAIADIFQKTTIGCYDFYEFMKKHKPKSSSDFVFLDPPYDCTFSTYDRNPFEQTDQQRLADYLINECEAKWMVVIKATDYIRSIYPVGKKCVNGSEIHITEFDKYYDVCIKSRNDKKAEHMIITNYEQTDEKESSHETQ